MIILLLVTFNYQSYVSGQLLKKLDTRETALKIRRHWFFQQMKEKVVFSMHLVIKFASVSLVQDLLYSLLTHSPCPSHSGVLLPFIPSQTDFDLQYSQLLGCPCHSRNTNGNWRYCNCTLVSNRACYCCGSDEPGHWIHTVQ